MISTKITKRVFIAFCDFFILSLSLYLSLSIRNLNIINEAEYAKVFFPFLLIIFINILAFYIYGLYDKMSVKIYTELNKRIINSLIFSSVIGAIIFYSFPSFSIAPKTILIIYILISSLLIFAWRRYVRIIIKSKKTNNLLIVAEGNELLELKEEIINNKVLGIRKIEYIDLSENKDLDLYTKIKNTIHEGDFNILAINMHHPHIKNSISLFYELLLEKVNIINFADLYEEILGKIPLKNIDAG